MFYSDIQKRDFTDKIKQYKYFRKENIGFLEFFKIFPLLPKNNNIKFLRKWDFDKFFLHKICYNVEPNLFVNSYLLIPKNLNKKSPGILALHEHNDEYKAGKSEVIGMVRNPEYTKLESVEPNKNHKTPDSKKQFAYAKELCEIGFIVLAPDFIGFEEYRDIEWELSDYYNEPYFLRGYEEMIASKFLLHGSSLIIKHLHDMYVAITILSSLKEVDKKKIGVIGHSLGGEIATILTAFDSRIKAGVSSCGTVSYEHFEKSNRMETAEVIIPGFRKEKKDFDFFLDMIQPTPYLATNGLKDTAVQMKKLLEKRRKNFRVLFFKGGHSFPEDIRLKAYSFLEENLC